MRTRPPPPSLIIKLPAVLLLSLMLTCTKEETGPEMLTGRLTITVDVQAARDFVDLLDITGARIRVNRAGGATALDTTIAVSSSQNTVQVGATVTLGSESESFTVVTDLLNQAGTVLFTSDPVDVTVSASGGAAPVAVEVTYIGPGAASANIEITTTPLEVLAGNTLQLEAVVRDAAGGTVDDAPVRWSADDTETASFPDAGSGLLQAHDARGGVTVTATVPNGVATEASVTVLARPSTLNVVSGNQQTGPPNQELPLPVVLELRATDDLPLAGTIVELSATDGILSSFEEETGPDGRVQVSWTLGPDEGPQQASAAVRGLPEVEITFTATASQTPIDDLLAQGIAALEDALFTAVNDLIRPPFSLGNLDLFTFTTAADFFAQANAIEPDDDTAAFGLAVARILSLEDDPSLRAAAEAWDTWFATNDRLIDLTGGTGPFPPTLEEQQDLLRTQVQPVLEGALELMSTVDGLDFVFDVTARMQGEPPETGRVLELDRTEVLGLQSWIAAALAGIDVALAYRTTPTPYGAAGFDAAMTAGSQFLTLAADGAARLTSARDRALAAVAHARDALDFLETETDDQSDDILQLDPTDMFPDCEELPCGLDAVDIQLARDVLADLEGLIQGPRTITPGVGGGETIRGLLKTSVVVDGSRFVTTPIADIKALFPMYQTEDGAFHWSAIAFDEWTFPDPTLNGILPGLTTTDDLEAALDLSGIWDPLRFHIDEWRDITTSLTDGGIYAITDMGMVTEVPADFSGAEDRPDLLSNPTEFTQYVLGFNGAGNVVQGLDLQGRLSTRPDDATTAWTVRFDFTTQGAGCCFEAIAEGPTDGTTFVLQSGSLWQVSTDYSATERLSVFLAAQPAGMIAAGAANRLIVVSRDGLVFVRTADDTSPWAQRPAMLPIDDPFEDRWRDLALHPSGGSVFAISQLGNLVEISGDLSTVNDRPNVPASNVIAMVSNAQTNELVALTTDGRLFSRPPDAATPWTLRLTLPRTIVSAPPPRRRQ